MTSARIADYINANQFDEPCLIVDTDIVRENYLSFAHALPDTRIFYAVNANPAPQILSLLAELGSSFDCASMREIEMAPCILAGPTCDSADVLYEKNHYPMPPTLTVGDEILIEGTGAYTTTYSAQAFNGFPPLRSVIL
ncbi:hypothetical protein [Aliiruegeria sabulilitoris]|uniref:hypothetical protein n=1 Tax=Aliiruegeria sabulilitoris TaxID=1510458 RepID=UPI00082AC246|nr:hypothetical protein [Aliiruegeria sabulilitoris]NDR59202.1 hypothetical protein [Pseudoruegeria sp. M32A2M]